MIGTFWALIPIIATLFVAFKWKNVFLALLTGLFLSGLILLIDTGALLPAFESIPNTLTDSYFVKTILFLFLTGAIMNVVSKSGGVEGLVVYFTEKRKIVKSRIGAQLISFILGLVLFVDATSSIVVTALVGKPFFHKFKVAKEKLALISNSTGSAIAWIVPFGGAGAFMTGLVSGVFVDLGVTDIEPFTLIINSVFFQFYGLALILVVLGSILFNIDTKKVDLSEEVENSDFEYETEIPDGKVAKPMNLILPIVLLLVSIFTILYFTGGHNIFRGDGGTAVFVAGVITLILTGVFYMAQGLVKLDTFIKWSFDGMKNLFELIVILVIATAFASLTTDLGVNTYLAGLASGVTGNTIILVGLLLAVLISYSTGTSGGTVAILFPILLPLAYQMGVPFEYVIGAIVSGAVFGDQNSPISDSVILTTTVTDTKVMDHVRTQMPFTGVALGLSAIVFIILTFIA